MRSPKVIHSWIRAHSLALTRAAIYLLSRAQPKPMWWARTMRTCKELRAAARGRDSLPATRHKTPDATNVTSCLRSALCSSWFCRSWLCRQLCRWARSSSSSLARTRMERSMPSSLKRSRAFTLMLIMPILFPKANFSTILKWLSYTGPRSITWRPESSFSP